VVPKLKGKTLAQAKKALTKANCKLGKVTKKKVGRKVKAGRVLSFKPGAGKRLASGTKINLTVGRR
jgi:beta-lactam-binding protein with PASTA domain